jgi:regulator of cell morphogenesis and NO signaling
MYQKTNQMIIRDMKVSDMILENPYFMLMLEHFGIGLVVHEKTVAQACHENSIDVGLFLTFANLFNGFDAVDSSNATIKDVPTIVRYLKTSHHYYLEEKLPKIRSYIRRMSELNDSSEILLVEKFFNEYCNEIIEHLNYENEVVYPYILDLQRYLTEKTPKEHLKTYSVKEYQDHHNDIEEKLTDLKNLLIKYLPQKEDQQIRRKLLFSLFELEYDLNIHSRIEDKILVPLAALMERNLGPGK